MKKKKSAAKKRKTATTKAKRPAKGKRAKSTTYSKGYRY
jgi:hypothetical protein|tara:strand:+ start:15998 stop:16114 length:117 start_codon:yes stop_codon:yes gene_type:complete